MRVKARTSDFRPGRDLGAGFGAGATTDRSFWFLVAFLPAQASAQQPLAVRSLNN